MVVHVVIALAAGYSVGSEFRRRSMRIWLACAGGNPIVALAGKLAPLFVIFFVIMLSVALILEGLLGISFKGDVAMIVAAGSLLIVGYLALGRCCSSWCVISQPASASPVSWSRRHSDTRAWDFRSWA